MNKFEQVQLPGGSNVGRKDRVVWVVRDEGVPSEQVLTSPCVCPWISLLCTDRHK